MSLRGDGAHTLYYYYFIHGTNKYLFFMSLYKRRPGLKRVSFIPYTGLENCIAAAARTRWGNKSTRVVRLCAVFVCPGAGFPISLNDHPAAIVYSVHATIYGYIIDNI